MKSFKVSIYVQGKVGTLETIVQANNESDARKLVQAQYASSLKSIGSIREVK